MTYEQAAYYRLLLLNGYPKEVEKYIDHALETENPLSDLTLDLSMCYSDTKKQLSVLNRYLSDIGEKNIDWDGAVFEMVLAFLRAKSESLPVQELVILMRNMAQDENRHDDSRWYTMYIADECYDECTSGYWSWNVKDFHKKLQSFLQDGTPFTLPPRPEPRKSLWKKFLNWLCA